jgi:ribosomal-protein-alanine N-acetyltransferase
VSEHALAPDIRIVQLDHATLAALADGDLAGARVTSPVELTPYLVSEERRGTWARRARQVVETPVDADWVTGVVRDEAAGLTIGGAGFHAAPDERGMVEVGYGVDPAHQGRGYGHAILAYLIERAVREPEVRVVRTSIRPDNAASLAVIARYDFVVIGEEWDEEDGLEIVRELNLQ